MQITFDFAGRRIVIDGAEKEVLSLIEAARTIAPLLPQLTLNAVGSVPPENPTRQAPPPAAGQDQKPLVNNGMTLREFAKSLNPKTHHERIAAISYFMKHFENKASFAPKEMDGWYVACGFPKPSAMPIALAGAKAVRYVANIGYGKWKVERDGENWVIGRLNRPSAERENGSE